MPLDTAFDRWKKRIPPAQDAHRKWKDQYEVDDCHDYFRGFQRKGKELDRQNDKMMIINRVLPAVRSALPSLYFREPFARVNAAPARADTTGQMVDQRAQLLQDTGNSIVKDPRTMFKEQTFISMKEGFWSFPCVEVGYTADFVEHPAAEGKPELFENASDAPSEASVEGVLAKIKQDLAVTITSERFYVRRIDPDSLLIPNQKTSILRELPWIGYSEKVYLEDLKAASHIYSNLDGLSEGEDGQVEIHKIWDQRTLTKLVIPAEGNDFILQQPFKRLPLFFLRFEIDPGEFRPIPLIHSWLQSQDEYNDGREFLRKERKARRARFTVDPSKFKPDEAKKFESEAVDQYAFTEGGRNDGSAIRPVEHPPMDATVIQTLTISRSEFDEVSGKSAQSRQVTTGDTATEAGLVNARQVAQENFDRTKVAEWLAAIIQELILQAVDKMALPRWVLINSDPFSEFFLTDAQQIAKVYRQITFQQLNQANASLTWDVTVDVESMSPVPEAQKKGEWMQALSLLANEGVAKILAFSPELLKKTLDLHNIKSAQDQANIARALAMIAQMQIALAQQANAPKGPGVASLPKEGPGPGFVPPPAPTALPAGPPAGRPALPQPVAQTVAAGSPIANRALAAVPGALPRGPVQ